MAETQERKRPFWMDEGEWNKRGLPKLSGNIANVVASGVPDLNWVFCEGLVGAWTSKDGMLIYHFYKKDRKEIYDTIHAEMDEAVNQYGRDRAQEVLTRCAEEGNKKLEKHPWWPNFKELLDKVFKDHFRFHPFKISFYPEVDSWSVIMTPPDTPVAWGHNQYEAPFSQVARLLGS